MTWRSRAQVVRSHWLQQLCLMTILVRAQTLCYYDAKTAARNIYSIAAFITFRVRHSRVEMQILVTPVTLCVCLSLAAFPRCKYSGVIWGNVSGLGVPSSHALLGGFAIGARVSLLRQHSAEREMSASACTRSMPGFILFYICGRRNNNNTQEQCSSQEFTTLSSKCRQRPKTRSRNAGGLIHTCTAQSHLGILPRMAFQGYASGRPRANQN